MPPAPKLGFSELCAEMAEVYAMALVRDVPFNKIQDPNTVIPKIKKHDDSEVTMGDLLAELKKLSWFDPNQEPFSSDGTQTLNVHEKRRRKARFENDELTLNSLFRGSSPNSENGPYISQFLLMGTCGPKADDGSDEASHKPTDGLIRFGKAEDRKSVV